MSPLALLYVLLASPIFSENIYSGRRFDNELLPLTHYHSNSFERLFRESPLETILSTPSWTRSNIFNRRSIIGELYPESSIFGESSYEPIMRHFSQRNVEVIRRLAETHPEMINVVIEKLLRPESRLFSEKLIRHVEPETLVFAHRLINKLPVYLREKIVRRLVKSVVRPSWTRRSSILNEVFPVEETLFHSEPRMTRFLSEKVIRRNVVERLVEKKIVKKIVKRVVKMIKKSPVVAEMLLRSTRFEEFSPLRMYTRRHSTEKRIVKKIVKRIVKKIVKNIIRNKRVGGYTPMPWNFCNTCRNTCSMMWSPMCETCDMMCRENTWTPSSWTPSTFAKKSVKKSIKKLIKKLSTEELLF